MQVRINNSKAEVKLTKTERRQLNAAAKICEGIEHVIKTPDVVSKSLRSLALVPAHFSYIGNHEKENTDVSSEPAEEGSDNPR